MCRTWTRAFTFKNTGVYPAPMDNEKKEEMAELQALLMELAQGYEQRYGKDRIYNSLNNTIHHVRNKLRSRDQ
jgi:hypothetical protein